MQDSAPFSSGKSSLSSGPLKEGQPEVSNPAVEETAPASAKPESGKSNLDQALASLQDTFGEHKGKLAIGAAAMLGLMVYYKWGEKSLAKEDPEEYERLQRIKNRVRHADEHRDAMRDPVPGPQKSI